METKGWLGRGKKEEVRIRKRERGRGVRGVFGKLDLKRCFILKPRLTWNGIKIASNRPEEMLLTSLCCLDVASAECGNGCSRRLLMRF